MTATLSRRAWGLDTPRDESDWTACMRDPNAWDVPNFSSTSPKERAETYRTAFEAVHECRVCPLLQACERQSTAAYVQHNCVYGGRVHFAGRWFDLAGFHHYVKPGISDAA